MAVTSGAVTIAEIRNWMNDTFVSKVEDQLNREILAVELFKQHNTGFTDGQAIVPINYARNTSASYRSENSALPDSGELGRARLSVDAKYLYSRMSLSGPAIESGRNNPNGLKATLQEEIDGALESLSNRANNYFFSGGGVIGYVCSSTDLNAAPVDFFGNVEHLDTSNPGGGASIRVDLVRMDTYAVEVSNAQLRVATSAGTSEAAFQVETLAAADLAAVPQGVPTAIRVRADQTYADTSTETVADQTVGIMSNLSLKDHFGLDRSTATGTYASLQSNFITKCVKTNGNGVDFTSSMLQELFTKIQRQSDKRPEVLFVEHGFMDQYVSILTTTASAGNFRITNNQAGKGADAGFNTQQMTYGSVPFRASRHAPKGCVIALAPSTWVHVTLKNPGMADLDGNVLSRVSNRDCYEAYARYYHNLVAKRPNANGILTGIKHS